MTISPEEVAKVYAEADLLHSREQVEAAIRDMAATITKRLADRNPLVLVVMNGALIPAGVLLSHLDFPLQHDYIHATRYRGATSGGELHWKAWPSIPIEGRTLLIVDDILDEGETLAAVVKTCLERGAAEVLSAVLVEKLHERKNGFVADFVGLQVEDRYVFGYGMDYKDYLRNAPGIYAVKGL